MSGSGHDPLDGSNLIGAPLPRPNAPRLAAGGGRYVDDIVLPGMVHVAYLRSPVAHGLVTALDLDAARDAAGVVGVFAAPDLAAVCPPLQTALETVPQHRSPPQTVLADRHVAWQGEPIAAVAASSRAEAEDAIELIAFEIDELPPVADAAAALEKDAPKVHDALDDNLAFAMHIKAGDLDAAFGAGAEIFEHTFRLGRQGGVPLEPRGIVADWNGAEPSLTVYQSHQSPHFLQAIYARHFDLPEHAVRVIAPDVGGAFGVKLSIYGDEVAAIAISRLLGRPVKYVPDRMEAFLSDAPARDFSVLGRIAVDADGRILGFGCEALVAIGAYSIYPRSSLGDSVHAASFLGAPYDIGALDASVRAAYQTKVPTGVIRGVGQPIACTMTEQLVDVAARGLGVDPLELRRRNYLRGDRLPGATLSGMAIEQISLDACLDRLAEAMDYEGLRAEQARLRGAGTHRGIGVATFLEQTSPGPHLYGPAGVPATAQDSCSLRFEPSGVVRGTVGATDQGQGTLAGITQIVAAAIGLPLDQVVISAGDSAGAQGGGAWASRGLAIGGEAAFAAARELRDRLLAVAAPLLQADPGALDVRAGEIVAAGEGTPRMSVAEVTRTAYFRQDQLPPDLQPELSVTRSFVLRDRPHLMANGVQASHLEVDVETGEIRLLGHWVVEDCGRVVNPLLVDEQIRGGVVMGLGAALLEHIIYDENAQLLNATLADYLLPTAAEMPDIVVEHIETRQAGTALGVKGAGEAGTIGAAAAVWCAVNDALAHFGAHVSEQPVTPEVVLRALGRI